MNLREVRIKNFRNLVDVSIPIDDTTVLVGENNSGKQKGDKSPELEEERRNCFVAITRTIRTLTLSYAERYRGWQKQPSRFLYEMGLLT